MLILLNLNTIAQTLFNQKKKSFTFDFRPDVAHNQNDKLFETHKGVQNGFMVFLFDENKTKILFQ